MFSVAGFRRIPVVPEVGPNQMSTLKLPYQHPNFGATLRLKALVLRTEVRDVSRGPQMAAANMTIWS